MIRFNLNRSAGYARYRGNPKTLTPHGRQGPAGIARGSHGRAQLGGFTLTQAGGQSHGRLASVRRAKADPFVLDLIEMDRGVVFRNG
jgi:hypothetical protein